MSHENADASKRAVDAFNGRDLGAFQRELDPEVEIHAVLLTMFGGEATVFRGHDGARELFQEVGEVFADFQVDISEIRDPDERVVAVGHLRGRGRASGAEVESPIAYVIEFKNGRIIRSADYFDPEEALDAAGLS